MLALVRVIAAWFGHAGPTPPPDFLVVGLGRSGTSLLMAMLNAHPEISVVPDTGLLRLLLRCAVVGLATGRWARPRSGRVNGYERFSREIRRAAGEAGTVGEKTPVHIEFVPVASVLWPDTRFIEIRRDPRAVLASRKEAGWSRGRPVWRHLVAMKVHARLGRDMERRLGRDRYTTVRFEALLEAPAAELAKVSGFLGLVPADEMLDYQEPARHLVRDGEDWKMRILSPPDPSRGSAWKGNLTPFEEDAVRLVMANGTLPVSVWFSRAGALALIVRLASRLAGWVLMIATLLLLVPLADDRQAEDAS
jgi:hypothetical protein